MCRQTGTYRDVRVEVKENEEDKAEGQSYADVLPFELPEIDEPRPAVGGLEGHIRRRERH